MRRRDWPLSPRPPALRFNKFSTIAARCSAADSKAGARACSAEALEALKNYQREDFEGIFEAMDGLPVTVRLLDPPLHEFLPAEDKGREELSKQLMGHYRAKPGEREWASASSSCCSAAQGPPYPLVQRPLGLGPGQASPCARLFLPDLLLPPPPLPRAPADMMGLKVLRRKLQALHEVNPMMGLRGCRLGVSCWLLGARKPRDCCCCSTSDTPRPALPAAAAC